MIGKPERHTQNRVIALFRDELKYRYLGDWSDRVNSNIDDALATSWLKKAGKTPEQIESMSFADIACGSGSFLLGVYECLLRYHTAWYNANPTKAQRPKPVKFTKKGLPHKQRREVAGECFEDPETGTLRLTLEKKRQILTNNVFGTDLDPQAVEVAQFSLYLKLLEDETAGTTHQYQLDFDKDALLPSLDKNIVCGNAIIGSDICGLFPITPEEEEDLRPMDYSRTFPEIFRRGGFDAVVGNPPYLNVDDTWGKGDIKLKYLKERYPAIYRDKTDLYFYFIAKAISLTKDDVGYIISRSFLQAYKADGLRGMLATGPRLRKVIDFQNYPVFKGVGITTCIILTSNLSHPAAVPFLILNESSRVMLHDPSQLESSEMFTTIGVDASQLSAPPWEIRPQHEQDLIRKIDSAGVPLSKILVLGQGMQTGANAVFGENSKNELYELGLKDSQIFQRLRNSDIRRYALNDSDEYLIYIESEPLFSKLPEKLQSYLESHSKKLKGRAAYKRKNCLWWRYTWPLHKDYYSRTRIVCPYLATENHFALVESGVNAIGLTDTTVLFENGQPESMEYLLALLNSRLLTFRFRSIGKMKSGGVLEYFWNSIAKLPIRRIDFTSSKDKAKHDELTNLVRSFMDALRQQGAATNASKLDFWLRKSEGINQQIDTLVYELYGLTKEEIDLVENNVPVGEEIIDE